MKIAIVYESRVSVLTNCLIGGKKGVVRPALLRAPTNSVAAAFVHFYQVWDEISMSKFNGLAPEPPLLL